MIDLLARRSSGGELYLNLARNHFAKHEWGEARNAVLRGLEKGNLSDEQAARQLLARISEALGLQIPGEDERPRADHRRRNHRRVA